LHCEAYVRAKGSSITDAERETIRKGLFDTSLKGESSIYNINSVRKELEIAKDRGDFASEELLNGRLATPTSFQRFMDSKKGQSESNSTPKKLITIYDPKNGAEATIDESQLDSAVLGGWERRQ